SATAPDRRPGRGRAPRVWERETATRPRRRRCVPSPRSPHRAPPRTDGPPRPRCGGRPSCRRGRRTRRCSRGRSLRRQGLRGGGAGVRGGVLGGAGGGGGGGGAVRRGATRRGGGRAVLAVRVVGRRDLCRRRGELVRLRGGRGVRVLRRVGGGD